MPPTEPEGGPGAASPGLGSWRWNAAALAVFLVALAVSFGEIWRAGPSQAVPVRRVAPLVQPVVRMDVSFEAWLVDRHARTLVRAPWRLFDTEHCAPGENTLTLGVPMIAMGVLAVPAAFFGEPLVSYDAAVLAVFLVSALAMYLLATDWTGVPAAGIAAGLLFAFSPLRIDNVYHPAELDIGWTALALFFARRLLAHGRWRDAVGLALAAALQIAASFYPTLAATCLAIPLALWLLRSYGLRRVRPAQLAFVVGSVAVAASIVLGPYLGERGATPGHLARGIHFYAPWADYLPGRAFFPGWVVVALAAPGLAMPRRLGLPRLARDPRLALAAGAILVALVAGGPLGVTLGAPFGGGTDTPIPYEMLSSWLPGLDTVRVVLRLAVGVVLVLALLAGVTVASAVRLGGRFGAAIGVGLVALAACATLDPPRIAEAGEPRIVAEAIRPSAETLAFYAELAARGNAGAILELPYEDVEGALWAPPRILVGAWHHRRTSACFGSYFLPEREEIRDLVAALPAPSAVRRLAERGFTTIVVHDPKSWIGAGWHARLAQGTGRRYARLRLLLETDVASAFAIEVVGGTRRSSPAIPSDPDAEPAS